MGDIDVIIVLGVRCERSAVRNARTSSTSEHLVTSCNCYLTPIPALGPLCPSLRQHNPIVARGFNQRDFRLACNSRHRAHIMQHRLSRQ
jgi:hypothetical protein